ncbi:MAG TPA: hypothetical protein DEP13_07990 [Gammaproteobacteria bacterium]|nr:MAG: hypothetical protein CBD74_05920 [Saprospirales bacterium TMED214]HCA36564.1 hypothetical protein [Gammaproteobacteria bacterium]
MAFSTSYGNSPDRFGHKDYAKAKQAGAADAEILQFLNSNPSLLSQNNAPGQGGLFDEIARSADSSSAYFDSTNPYKTKLESANTTIGELEDEVVDLGKYKTDFDDLKTKYDKVVSDRDTYEQDSKKFSDLYDEAKPLADLYNEFTTGQQLQGLRGGATGTPGNQTEQMRGTLASGQTGYSSSAGGVASEDDSKVNVSKLAAAQASLTDSVLNRDTPVVQLMNQRRGKAGQTVNQVRPQSNAAGTSSYYASRFT